MVFVKVKVFSANVFFKGVHSVIADLDVPDSQAEAYFDRVFGSGNWQSSTLKSKVVKIKEKNLGEYSAL